MICLTAVSCSELENLFAFPVESVGMGELGYQSITLAVLSTWPACTQVHSGAKVLVYESAQRECGSVPITLQRCLCLSMPAVR
jgi:hypothetical protein